jgi:hypothetical protein
MIPSERHVWLRRIALGMTVAGVAASSAQASDLRSERTRDIQGITDARHAALILRDKRDRSLKPVTVGRPAPLGRIVAQLRERIPSPVVASPAHGFDPGDAGIGVAIGLGLGAVLLTAGGNLALRRMRRAADHA